MNSPWENDKTEGRVEAPRNPDPTDYPGKVSTKDLIRTGIFSGGACAIVIYGLLALFGIFIWSWGFAAFLIVVGAGGGWYLGAHSRRGSIGAGILTAVYMVAVVIGHIVQALTGSDDA